MTLSEQYSGTLFAVRDMNDDGRADIFVSSAYNFVLTQNAGGTFVESAKLPGYFVSYEGWNALPIADLTGDGLDDVVLPDGNGRVLYVQQPGGTFAAPVPYNAYDGAFIDINGDGRPDAIGRLNFVSILAPP